MTQRKLVSHRKGDEGEEQGVTWRGNLRLKWMKLRREQSILRRKWRGDTMSLIVFNSETLLYLLRYSSEEEEVEESRVYERTLWVLLMSSLRT